ncbi:unnamed protein product, partial [Rotaria sp. Silwood2]
RGVTNIIPERPIIRPTLIVTIKFPHNRIRSSYKTKPIRKLKLSKLIFSTNKLDDAE